MGIINRGANEYVAGYINNGNGSLQTYGSSLVNSSIVAHKDAYQNNYNQMSGKYGDAVYEISNSASSANGSWFGDGSTCPNTSGPFFRRGGIYDGNSYAGTFGFVSHTGGGSSYLSFCSVLVAFH